MTKNGMDLYRRFLLGRLEEGARTDLEERLIEDPVVFEQIEAAESDLVDEWVRGELSPEEQRFLELRSRSSPRLAERYRVAVALARHLEELPGRSPAKPKRYRALLLAASLVGVVVLSQATSRIFLSREQPMERSASVLLWGDSVRGGSHAESVAIEPGQMTLDLRIDLETSSSEVSYQLLLKGPDGHVVWEPAPLGIARYSWGSGLSSEVPVALLQDGAHQVEIHEKRGDRESLVAFYELEVRLQRALE